VVFPCGYTVGPDGDTLYLYYGAADTSMALATASIRALLGWLEQHGQPHEHSGWREQTQAEGRRDLRVA
jgi:beta-1,4-mannooligosaccharide phosphorylase